MQVPEILGNLGLIVYQTSSVEISPDLVLSDSNFLHVQTIAFVLFTIFDSTVIVTTSYKTRYVTEFWKITLMGAPETIRIF